MPSSVRQGKLSTGHPVDVFDITTLYAAPTDGFQLGAGVTYPLSSTPNTLPLHVMSPITQTDMGVTGLVVGISSITGALPTAGGFRLTLWIADPNGFFWFQATPVVCDVRQAFVTYDIDSFPLYIQVDSTTVAAPGNIVFHFMDM